MPITNLNSYSALAQSTSNMRLKDSSNDRELAIIIRGAIQENRLDQKKIYEKFYNLIFSICLRYSSQKAEASSFVNLCFLKIFKNLEKFENKGSFEGWICKISIRVCIDQIRSRMRYEKQLVFSENPVGLKVEENILDHLALEDLYNVIQELPDTFQTVFCLHTIEGYKHQEIAELLEISIGTSRWYLSKAKETLKLKLKNYER